MPEERYRELDLLRGLAVLSMILFHLCFDLAFFYGWNIPVREGAFILWSRGTAMTFLMVMGMCFVISWERTLRNPGAETPSLLHDDSTALENMIVKKIDRASLRSYQKYLYRGLTIFMGGMIISLATYLIAPGAYIKFGILHLIGVSALLQPLFVRFRSMNVLIGAAVSTIGLKGMAMTTENPLLFPFGIVYPGFFSLDYYPLFPWFGFVLTGMGLGYLLYIPVRNPLLAKIGSFPAPQWLLLAGRRALPLYFLHQPVLLLVLWLLLGSPLQNL